MPDIDSDVPRSLASAAKLRWQPATVIAIEPRIPTVKSYLLRFDEPLRFVAGQHMDVRLTAPDGYQAQRSYSIASAPETHDRIELTIERLQDGEVSPFFHDTVVVGDEIELRGPIGGYFNWSVEDGGPVLLIGGGSGVVPLACILRHRAARQSSIPMTLVYSARTTADLIFGDELHALSAHGDGFEFSPTFTRELNPAPQLRVGRIDGPLLRAALEPLPGLPKVSFICGKNSFVEVAARALLDLGIAAATIRTERYGG